MTETKLTPVGQSALAKLLALRKLSYDTSTVTRRSQNDVLRTLNNEDLTAVAEALAEHQEKFGY